MEEIKIINSKKEFLIEINYLSNTFFIINSSINEGGKFEIIEETLILIWENDEIEYYKKKSQNIYYNNNIFTEYYFINNTSSNTSSNTIYYIDNLLNIYDSKLSNNKIIGKQINNNECKINNNNYYLYENKFYEKTVYDKIILFEYTLIFMDNNDNIINKNFIFNKLTYEIIEKLLVDNEIIEKLLVDNEIIEKLLVDNEIIEKSLVDNETNEKLLVDNEINKLNGIYSINNDLLNVKFEKYESNFILTSDKVLISDELLNKYYQEITINNNNFLSIYILDKKNNIIFNKNNIDKKYLILPTNDYKTLKIYFNDDNFSYFNYDTILDLYIIVEKITEIYIIHNSWNDTLILNNYDNTLKRKNIEDETGKFEYNNNKIIVYWDKWDKEVFIKNNDNNYNLCKDEKTEYIEIFHKNWNDKCIIKDNFITRISSNNESGIIEYKNDNTIEIKWNNWDCEKFYIFNDNYYYEKIIKIGIIKNIKYYFNVLNNFIYNNELNEIGNFNFIDSNKIFVNLEKNKKEYNYKEIDNNIIFIEETNIILVKYKLEETYIIYENNELEYNIFSKNDKNIYGKYKLYDNFIEVKWNYNKKELYKKNNNKYYLNIDKKYKLIDFNKIYYLNIEDKYFYDDNMKYDFLYNKNNYFIILNDNITEFIEYNIGELIYISKNFYEYIKKENFNKKLYNNLYYDNKKELELNILDSNNDLDLKILLHWYNNKENNNIYSLNNFYKKYNFFDIVNFKKKNSIKINDENTIMNWIIKYRFSNLFYNSYDVDIIENNIIENNIIENNIIENNIIENNKIFLVFIVKNKLDIDILSNIIFKKKNIVIFIIIQFDNDIFMKDLFEYTKNNIDIDINYFILKTKTNTHYFNIKEISKIINKYFINDYNLITNDNISLITNENISVDIDNSIFIYIKEMSSINEELFIHNIYLKNINIKIENNEESNIIFNELDNYFIKMLYIINNIIDLIKLLIIYYLIVRKNINNLDNIFYLNYYYLLDIFNFYNENMIIIK